MNKTIVAVILSMCLLLTGCERRQVGVEVKHTLTGDIRLHEKFHSQFLPTDRNIIVYVPPGYETNTNARYPVLYMQDGQNIFDSATSFFAGKERHMDEVAESMILAREIEPLIIVGIYSTGRERINEYPPTTPQGSNQGGEADLYGRMLTEEIIPFINAHYRTLKGPENTGVGGGSLGGLVSLYLGLKYPETFGKLVVTSPSAFWDNEVIVRDVRALKKKPDLRIWLAVGTNEDKEFVQGTRDLRDALVEKGWVLGEDLEYVETAGGTHDSESWSHQVKPMLKFLFPRKAG